MSRSATTVKTASSTEAPSPAGQRPPRLARRRVRGAAGAAATLLFCLPCAAEPPKGDEVRRLNREGVEKFSVYAEQRRADPASAELDEACTSFARSLKLQFDTTTLKNLSACRSAQLNYDLGVDELTAAIGEARRRSPPPDVREAKKELATLKGRAAKAPRVEVYVPAAEQFGLEIHYDERSLGRERWGRPFAADPGEHTVTVRGTSGPVWTTTIFADEGAPLLVVVPPVHQAPGSPALAEACAALGLKIEGSHGARERLNLANCHSAMGQYRLALRSLAAAEKQAGGEGVWGGGGLEQSSSRRARLLAEVQRERSRVERVAPHLKLEFAIGSRTDLEIVYDEERTPREQWAQANVIDVGARTVSVLAAGSSVPLWTETVLGKPGFVVRLSVPSLPPSALATPAPVPRPSTDRPVTGYVVGGLGLATLGAGLVSGALAMSNHSGWLEDCPERHNCSAQAAAKRETAGTQATFASVAVPVGAAAAALGAYLVFFAGSHSKVKTDQASLPGLRIAPNLTGLTISGGF